MELVISVLFMKANQRTFFTESLTTALEKFTVEQQIKKFDVFS
jgi:hypothetical protein